MKRHSDIVLLTLAAAGFLLLHGCSGGADAISDLSSSEQMGQESSNENSVEEDARETRQNDIDEEQIETQEEFAVAAALLSNLLRVSWQSPNEIDPDHLFEFYEALVVLGRTEKIEGEYVPAEIVEGEIANYFDIPIDYIRTNNYYSEEENGYWVGGLGNVVSAVIDDIAQQDQMTVISYSLYFQDQLQRCGDLTVMMQENGTYQYRSNNITKEVDAN